jgi:hypothetical protein
MRYGNPVCFGRGINSAWVLQARIVDAAVRPVRPAQVATIEYSIVARGLGQSNYVALVVSDVLLPTLVNDDSWSVDVAGYNFRHNVTIDESSAVAPTCGRIELRYIFTSTDNMKSIIRFRLKVT